MGVLSSEKGGIQVSCRRVMSMNVSMYVLESIMFFDNIHPTNVHVH